MSRIVNEHVTTITGSPTPDMAGRAHVPVLLRGRCHAMRVSDGADSSLAHPPTPFVRFRRMLARRHARFARAHHAFTGAGPSPETR